MYNHHEEEIVRNFPVCYKYGLVLAEKYDNAPRNEIIHTLEKKIIYYSILWFLYIFIHFLKKETRGWKLEEYLKRQ